MKKVWITALGHDEALVAKVLGTVRQYGLDGNGHFWTDDLKNMAWMGPKEQLADSETGLWVLLGEKDDLKDATARFGLSLLTITVLAARGNGFPILFVDTGSGVGPDDLPTPLKGSDFISMESPSLGAKMVAKVNTPISNVDMDYRLDIHANTALGVWFEVGPSGAGSWDGAMFGVDSGEIDFHGVGEAGKLPQKTVLEYQMRGLKLGLGDTEYTAWAVKNALNADTSYYIRVRETPSRIVFGSYSAGEETTVHSVQLF